MARRATIVRMETAAELLSSAEADAAELRRKDAELAEQEDRVRLARADVRTQLADLTRAIEVMRKYMKLPATPEQPTARSQSVAQLSYEIMLTNGGQMGVRELLAELVKVGKLKGGTSDYGTVFGALQRNSALFTKVGPGQFATVPPSAPERPS